MKGRATCAALLFLAGSAQVSAERIPVYDGVSKDGMATLKIAATDTATSNAKIFTDKEIAKPALVYFNALWRSKTSGKAELAEESQSFVTIGECADGGAKPIGTWYFYLGEVLRLPINSVLPVRALQAVQDALEAACEKHYPAKEPS